MRASVVTGVVAARDAISASTLDKVQALQEIAAEAGEPLELKVYCHSADLPTPGLKLVSSVTEVVLDRHFVESDLVLYEFGIYSDLFDSIHLAPPEARKLVHFHNVTPPELVPPEQREVLERSMVQLLNLERADLVLTPSEFNARTLREHGLSRKPVLPLNLVVDAGSRPAPQPRKLEPGQALDLLYVGRFVRAKGVMDAVRAVRRALDAGAGPIRLTLIGNEAFSDAAYIRALRELIQELRLQDSVRFAPSAGDEARDRAYAEAHALVMPSLHEGFCVPVIEALMQGCFVIASDAGNLPWSVNGLGCVVPAGDAGAFARAMETFSRELRAGGAAITTGRGPMSAEAFHQVAREYALGFSRAALKEQLRDALQKVGVLGQSRHQKPGAARRSHA